MRRTWGRILLVVATVVVSGCAGLKGAPQPVFDQDAEVEEIKKLYGSETEIKAQYKKLLNSPSAQKTYRNEVILARMRAYDIRFNEFKKELFRGEAGKNIATDVALIGMGAAAALVGGTTGRALAAAITGLAGAKASFDKNVYFEKTMAVIVAAMIARRKEKELEIRIKMRTDTDAYPLDDGLRDVRGYEEAGTISEGIISLAATAGAQANAADQKIKAVITSGFQKDAEGDRLRVFWKPDGKTVNTENAKKLREWLKENGVDSLSIPFFLRSELFADARKKAVKDLKLP